MEAPDKKETSGVYGYTPEGIANPKRILLGKKWVATGGKDIEVVPEAPRKPYKVPAATQEELAELYKRPSVKKYLTYTRNVPTVSKPNSGSNT